jgi:hypothetical protein
MSATNLLPRFLSLLLLSVLTLAIVAPSTAALSAEQRKVFYGKILAYDVAGDECGSGSSGDSALSADGENNAEIAFNYFASADRLGTGGNANAKQQAAGIVGNLIVESGVDPTKQQYGGGPGRGIAQWSVGDRWDTLLAYARARSIDPLDLTTQLDFIWFEMTGQPAASGVAGGGEASALEELRRQTSPGAAAESFMLKFERPSSDPAVNHIDLRKSEAERIFTAYAGNAQGTVGSSGGGCAAGSGTVNSEGYAFPLEGRKDEIAAYTSLPCTAGPNGCHHDGTPAFDLHVGTGDATIGRKAYAIHKGVAESVTSGYHGTARCYSIQFRQTGSQNPEDDGWYYWYGHIENPTVRQGQEVEAGTVLAQVGDSVCATSEQTHLHIDRGAPKGERGGSDCCRDPGFIDLINTLYEELSDARV